ncbi:transporter [Caldimonas tepidiphila]|uniref:transporter n=1 Tax=Caldimonas tepidiphila TaxID=2315841 RepID=UPI001300B5BB|nr:transporter [Caldimonas tepidiphila]
MNTHHSIAWLRIATAAAALTTAALSHAAGMPDPGDYIPAPAGTTVLALYAQHFKGDKVYDGNERVQDDLGLRLDVAVLRGMHYFRWNGMPADLELIVPSGRQRVSSAAYRESGIGNLALGATLWPQSDDASGVHTGVAAYLSLPSGRKQAEGLFVSEDRYALDLEFGHVRRLAPRWSLDLIGQFEAYTRDDSTGARREPMARGFAHLSYHLSDASRLAFSVRQTAGMKETVDGAVTLRSRNDTNLMLTWAWQMTDAWQIQAQYAKDIQVRSGPATEGVQLRLATAF